MKKFIILLLLFSCLNFIDISICSAEEDQDHAFITQVIETTGPVFISKGNMKYPLMERVEKLDTRSVEITKLLESGISKTSMKLGKYAKNFMHYQIINGKNDLTAEIYLQPLFIFLKKGGNRPKQGFFLKGKDENIDMTFCHYIEMPPDPVQFETLFAHENGHLIDYYLGKIDFKDQPARFVHTAPAVTDYLTAYIEGWGIHFETMMVEATQSDQARSLYTLDHVKDNAYFIHIQDLMGIAHKSKRYSWVKGNLFAFQRAYKPYNAGTAEALIKNYVYNWMNSDHDSGKIKNAQQMLSSEGVAATFFYRLINDPDIQKRYQNKNFYVPFLNATPDKEPAEIFTPLENAYLKVIYAKYMLIEDYKKAKNELYRPLLLDFSLQYIKVFPEDASDFLTHFYMTTYFTTAIKDSLALYNKVDGSSHFTMYDPEQASNVLMKTFEELQAFMKEVKAEKEIISKYLGEPLWIQNDKFDLGEKDSPYTLSLNLNSAEKFELMTIPGMTEELADKYLVQRESSVFFSCLNEMIEKKIFGDEMNNELKRMHDLFGKRK